MNQEVLPPSGSSGSTRSLADTTEVWRVSAEGGIAPLWRRDGRELFFVDPANRLQAVSTSLGSTFSAGEPKVLFVANLDESGGRQYDASADRQRFLLNRGSAGSSNPIVVAVGFRDWVARRLIEEQ